MITVPDKSLEINVNLDPRLICTAQQKGARVVGNHIMFYTKKKVRDSEAMMTRAILQAIKRKCPAEKAIRFSKGVPLKVEAIFFFPYPKSTAKFRRKDCEPMVERPDVDNLAKSFLDCLTRLQIIADDNQISQLSLNKVRTVEKVGHIYLRVEAL